MVESMLKVIHFLEVLRQGEHPRMLNVYGLQSTKISNWLWELEADLGISKTVFKILMQDLGMKCVVAKFIPQLLLPKQKEHCAAFADDLIQMDTNEPDFLKKVIDGDEWWVYR